MVTMRDVARRAGVSQSTVSHHLNGTRPIHPDTQRAIREAVEETGYVHDALARSLRTGRTSTVGLAISAITNPYFTEFVRAIENHGARSGRSLLLVDTGDDPERERAAISQLLAQRPAAVLFAPCRETAPSLDLLLAQGIPTILVDRILPDLPAQVDAVGVHNRQPMCDLVAHLVGLGHREIVLLAGLAGITTSTERVEGYHEGMAALPGQVPRVRHAGRTTAETESALGELFDDGPTPTALIGGNNQATISAMRWLCARGLSVPDDVSLASFDDFEWADLFEPRLTALHQPIRRLGQTAVDLLADRIDDAESPGRTVRLDPHLIIRDSTAPPPGM